MKKQDVNVVNSAKNKSAEEIKTKEVLYQQPTNPKATTQKNENLVQVAKFVGFSVSAGVIQVASFTLLNELIKWSYWPSYLIALVLSVLWNFTLNREFTFKSANNVPVAMLLIAAYYAVFTPITTIAGEFVTRGGWNEYLVLFLTMALNMVTEFLFCKYVVYKNSINTNNRANKSTPKQN